MKKISLLGSTGSIGTQTLDVVAENPNDFKVVGLSANSSIDLLETQIRQFHPYVVAVMKEDKAEELRARVKDEFPHLEVVSGLEGLIKVATIDEAELVLTAVVGAIGLEPTYAAICAGKDIALANKETLVADGERMMAAAKEHNVKIIPVDSEHSAIWQCIEGYSVSDVEKIILTCSGGPFFGKKTEELAEVTVDDALKHPTWSMGRKISVDSATLVNKGLEVIEAHHLFGLSYDNIEVVVHPQSTVHSFVQFKDGNLLAQCAVNDMRIPISYALYYPERRGNSLPRLGLHDLKLEFYKPDTETFRGLNLAYQAGRARGKMPAIFNEANEKAVARFLAGEIGFLEIYREIEAAMG